MPEPFDQAESAAQFLLAHTPMRPTIALVLGSGLGSFADELTDAVRIHYSQIPFFPRSTAIGHPGQMLVAKSGQIPVMAIHGGLHLSKVHSVRQFAFHRRSFGRMGSRPLVLAGIAG